MQVHFSACDLSRKRSALLHAMIRTSRTCCASVHARPSLQVRKLMLAHVCAPALGTSLARANLVACTDLAARETNSACAKIQLRADSCATTYTQAHLRVHPCILSGALVDRVPPCTSLGLCVGRATPRSLSNDESAKCVLPFPHTYADHESQHVLNTDL